MEEWPQKEKCPFQNGYAFRTDIHTTVKVINLNLLYHVLIKQAFQQLSATSKSLISSKSGYQISQSSSFLPPFTS